MERKSNTETAKIVKLFDHAVESSFKNSQNHVAFAADEIESAGSSTKLGVTNLP